ncbi:MAG: 3-dehydroquinate synthase [Oscillospiraceae bacterium]|jgi:3-dehydroquinate synthase|nr:3-dehydroquinate synthase [Oscillospiraceae bacterium]
MNTKTLTVNAASRSYDIAITDSGFVSLRRVLGELGADNAVFVTDSNIAGHYGAQLGGSPVLALTPGEENKTLAGIEQIYHFFTAQKLHRNSVAVAFGGGIVGDMTGFAAATYMRGIRFVQMPTTLVACVDSSVGGKTGVNLAEGKNLVGAFWQPSAVIIDSRFLETLPERERLAGMAEVVKYFALGERKIAETTDISELIYLCCKAKAAVVAEDELDTGARMTLNFGHTFGHAIEKYYDYKRYNHGEAVAIGMRLALETGQFLGVTPENVTHEVIKLMTKSGLTYNLDVSARAFLPLRELVPLMLGDKKNSGGSIKLVLLEDIGKPVMHEISAKELEELFK